MSTKFCNYNLILYILRLIYHRFIGQKLSKARHSLDELLNLKIHFFSKINSGFPADSTYLQLFYNSATQLPWVHLFGGEFPCQNEIPLLSLVNKSSYFLMIKIYENTIGGGDYQNCRNQRMMVTGYALNAMTVESLGLPWWLSSKECASMQESQEMQV